MTVPGCYWRAIVDAVCLRLGLVPRWMRHSPYYPSTRSTK